MNIPFKLFFLFQGFTITIIIGDGQGKVKSGGGAQMKYPQLLVA